MDVTGHGIENLAKAEINNMPHSPLIHKASSSITEGHQIGQAKHLYPCWQLLIIPSMIHLKIIFLRLCYCTLPQWFKWGWQTCSSLHSPSCPSGIQHGPVLSYRPQEPPLISMTFQIELRAALHAWSNPTKSYWLVYALFVQTFPNSILLYWG